MVAILYGEGLDNFRCHALPADLAAEPIADLRLDPADTTGADGQSVIFFLAGRTDPVARTFPVDSAFRGRKPLEVRATPLALAEVVFEKVDSPGVSVKDTLDALEMRDTSQAVLARILERESPSRDWAPRKVDGRIAIRRLYAYAVPQHRIPLLQPHAAAAAGRGCRGSVSASGTMAGGAAAPDAASLHPAAPSHIFLGSELTRASPTLPASIQA
jgi:hypothetical protein